MKNFPTLIKKYRWLAVALSIGVLWLMGYASLSFIFPDKQYDSPSVSQLEPVPVEPATVLAEENDRSDPDADNGSDQQSNQSDSNTADNGNVQSEDERACRQLSESGLATWLEQRLAEANSEHQMSLNKLSIEAGLPGLLAGDWLAEETDKLAKLLSSTKQAINQEYERLLALPGC